MSNLAANPNSPSNNAETFLPVRNKSEFLAEDGTAETDAVMRNECFDDEIKTEPESKLSYPSFLVSSVCNI